MRRNLLDVEDRLSKLEDRFLNGGDALLALGNHLLTRDDGVLKVGEPLRKLDDGVASRGVQELGAPFAPSAGFSALHGNAPGIEAPSIAQTPIHPIKNTSTAWQMKWL